jgi:thiamine biosynthesis lipoprotein
MKIFQIAILILMTTSLTYAEDIRIGKTTKRITSLMSSRCELIAVSEDNKKATEAIDKCVEEILRIENIISEWKPDSQISEINKMAGKSPVKVGKELLYLIKRSKKVSELTDGAFDISFLSVGKLWVFSPAMTDLPDADLIAAATKKVNYKNIIVDENESTVFLKEEGMKIGTGGIGQGFAANKAKAIMIAMGITSGIINMSGDVIAWGNQEDGQPWKIQIGDPVEKGKALAWLNITDMAVVTSGDYEKFTIIHGKKYCHIFDPHTGYPITTGIKSATVICADVEIADALATSLCVLGEKKALELISKLKDTECIIINEENKIITSPQLKQKFWNK